MTTELRYVGQLIPAPGRVPQLHGLLAACGDLLVPEGARWEAGLTIWPDLNRRGNVLAAWEGLPPGAAVLPADLEPQAAFTYYPYGVLMSTAGDTTVGYTAHAYEQRVSRGLDATLTMNAEREFWLGEASPADPDNNGQYLGQALVRDAQPIYSSATPVDPVTALAALQQYLAVSGTGDRGMIHARPELVLRWVQEGLVEREGPRLVCVVRGDTVVAGSGYPGTGPTGDLAATPAGGHTWAYATGPVFKAVGPPQTLVENHTGVIRRATGDVTARTFRHVATVHDGTVRPGAVYVELNPNAPVSNLLLQDGTALLTESGDNISLEG